MKDALLDNWTIEKIMDNFDTKKPIYTEEVIQLLYALTLWDDVYYLDNEHSSWWNHVVDNNESLFFLKKLKKCEASSEFVEAIANDRYFKDYSNQYTGVVARRALEYMCYAEKYNLNYLPTGKRAHFLNTNDMYGKVKNRVTIIEAVNEELEYLKEVNKNLIEADIKFVPDCLLDLVANEKLSFNEVVNNINAIRRDPRLVYFKSWVTDVENEIKAGRSIKKLVKCADEFKANKDYKLWMNMAKLGANIGICVINVKFGLSIPNIPSVKFVSPHLLFPIMLYQNSEKMVIYEK